MENLVNYPSDSFWKGKRVLITGHTGFKGSWLSYWLTKLGADVTGIGLAPITSPALYDLLSLKELIKSHLTDILDLQSYKNIVAITQPEVVFHLAAQPLVRESYKQPVSTFATNLMGTVNTLELIRLTSSIKSAVLITTDKVYENKEWIYPYRETDRLGGYDPYSASKATCEIAVDSYRSSFFGHPDAPKIATARAGNVIGGGDWSADRLIPDAIKAWNNDETLVIRKPNATRPWQHVIDPLAAYILLAEKLYESAGLVGAYNFGPDSSNSASVKEVVQKSLNIFGEGKVQYQTTDIDPHEANSLSLDTSKSKIYLKIRSVWNLESSICRTIDWYKALSKGTSARQLCDADLEMHKVNYAKL